METAPKSISIAENIRTRVDALLANDPLSQKIIKQWEAVARARGVVDPKQIEAIGKRAAIAGNALTLVASVVSGGSGILDIVKANRIGKYQLPASNSANTVAQRPYHWGAAKIALAPVLFGTRALTHATERAGAIVNAILTKNEQKNPKKVFVGTSYAS